MWVFFVMPVSAQNAPSTVQHRLMAVDLEAGQEKVLTAPFFFQAFALSDVVDVQVRFFQQRKWTDWSALGLEEDEWEGSELLFLRPTTVFSLKSPRAKHLQVTLLQLPESAFQLVQSDEIALDINGLLASSVPPKFHIVSREEWGADESLGTYVPEPVDESESGEKDDVNICAPIETAYPGQFQLASRVVYNDERGQPLVWPRRYSTKIKKVVIHHTASSLKDLNGDSRVDSRDYRAAVQGIYTYHTLSRGWGDLGYHYLVDPDGNVYEGRAGGLGVIAAHVLCQNSNTVGISVMGNFEQDALSEKAFTGLVNITKYVTDTYGINPLGESAFRGQVMPHIVTHAEVGKLTKSYIGTGATQCPGDQLVSSMERLRKVVAQGGVKPDYSYEVVGTPSNLVVHPLQSFQATIRLKNTGAMAWRQVQLFSKSDKEPMATLNVSISSGQEADILVPLQADLEGGSKKLALILNIDSYRQKQLINLSYKVTSPQYRYQLVSFEGARDTLLTGEQRVLTLRLKNTSNFPWLQSGPNQLQIREGQRKGKTVDMVPRGLAVFLPADVAVGAEVEIEIPVPPQKAIGTYVLELLPVVGKDTGLKGERMSVRLAIEAPKFGAEILPLDKRKRVAKGYEEIVDFQLVNKSNFAWEPGTVWYRLEGGEKQLVDQLTVPGKGLVIPVAFRAGYAEPEVSLKGVVGIDALPANVELKNFRKAQLPFEEFVSTKGTVKLTAEVVAQSRTAMPATKGVNEEWVDLKNTGNTPWYREGNDGMTLVINDGADFADVSWQKRRVAGFLQQDIVKPGEVGRFILKLKVSKIPRRTTYDEFVPMGGDIKVRMKGKIRFGVEIEGTREKREVNIEAGSLNLESGKDEVKILDSGFEIPPMRVWLTDVDQGELQVTSPGKFIVWDSASVQVRNMKAGDVFSIKDADVMDGTVFRVKAQEAPAVELKNWGTEKVFGTKKYLDNTFRNVLEFQWEDDQLIVINELPLEDYMRGIAEVPETDDQPQEKRKTIAVLSRSYALHYLISGYEKFPGKPYNAANSPAVFQKYLGYGFEQRSPKWQEALRETEGEVVLVDGQWSMDNGLSTEGKKELVLRAAYFSCTDGDRTKSWDEVWPDNEYFQKFGDAFQSVQDPLGDDPTREGTTACGHQVGLSGYGATQMARKGENYRDIIQYYYQGVEVRKW